MNSIEQDEAIRLAHLRINALEIGQADLLKTVERLVDATEAGIVGALDAIERLDAKTKRAFDVLKGSAKRSRTVHDFGVSQ